MYQKLTIVGRLGRDPELRYTPSGQAVCNYSVATDRVWTGSDGRRNEETTWFRVSSWGKRAEIDNQYLQKGSMILVEGRLNTDRETGGPRIWTDRDGNPRASFEMTAENVKFLGGGRSGGGGSQQGDYGSSGGGQDDDFGMSEDEIPF